MAHNAVGALCLLVLTGCQVYDPALIERRDTGAPAGCEPRRVPPPRPTAPDDGEDVGEVGFAVKNVLFEQDGDQWRQIGYDLDGLCSTALNRDVECVPPAPGASREVDGVGGTDNAFGHLLYPLVQFAVPGLQEASRAFQNLGNGSVLIDMTGWNGLDDDARVRVVMTVTVFGTPANADGSPPDVTITATGPELPGGEAPPPPAWDGNDYFWARDDAFIDRDPTRPLIVDDNAYVSGRVLVINPPERTDFIFPGDDVGLLARLTNAVATGRISADRSTLDEVTVAGRWSVNDLLLTAESVGVCEGTDDYTSFQAQSDRIADVRSRPGTGGEGVACDAISVGISFEGYGAKLGGLAPGPAIANPCLDGGVPDGGVPDGGFPDAGVPDGGPDGGA